MTAGTEKALSSSNAHPTSRGPTPDVRHSRTFRHDVGVRAFSCQSCGRLVSFESSHCLQCDQELGFDWDARQLVAMRRAHRRCANDRIAGCNGLVLDDGAHCASCAMTRTRPADDDRRGLGGFASAEADKRRLLFELGELGLPVVSWREQPGGLAFDLLSSAWAPVSTGHANGLVTLDLHETDSVEREARRRQLDEPYRTVLGHLRHEIAHYYQPILAPEGTPTREESRRVFGDDREDYQQAIDRHYAEGPPDDWERRFVSAYATMHPWEDWAETFARYLHIRDTLQTAEAYGLRVDGPQVATTDSSPVCSDPRAPAPDLGGLLDAWLRLTYALNAINRSMGAEDLYPFALPPVVQRKLAFIDGCVRAAAASEVVRALQGVATE